MLTDPQTRTQTGPITKHCAAKLSVQCNDCWSILPPTRAEQPPTWYHEPYTGYYLHHSKRPTSLQTYPSSKAIQQNLSIISITSMLQIHLCICTVTYSVTISKKYRSEFAFACDINRYVLNGHGLLARLQYSASMNFNTCHKTTMFKNGQKLVQIESSWDNISTYMYSHCIFTSLTVQ